jgi:DNA (cytosine-5)-methyltransferase 1
VLTVGSLFSGIGGFDLGLERAGMRTLWFCEQNDFARRVLAAHWPEVPCYWDVRELVGRSVEPVDVLCGGFPCQDLSVAGKGAGIGGARSGLWSEYARLVRELRPRYVVVENVSALLARGLDVVLGDLAACGYDAEWDCIPASAVGAPHQRDRVWLVAYPECGQLREQSGRSSRPGRSSASLVAVDGETQPVADPDDQRRHRAGELEQRWGQSENGGLARAAQWSFEPSVGRVVDGFPGRVEQLAALGNALVPQIAEWIGRRIIEHEQGRLAA